MTYGEWLVHRVDSAWAIDNEEDGKRSHLGASVIGNVCMRAVWFSWLWADREPFEGRMLRLFNRGHNQEGIFTKLLQGIGVEVLTHNTNGERFRVSALGGHTGGELDGVAHNLPELDPNQWVLLEYKTHKEKLFVQLKRQGLNKAFPKHYKQAQYYMHLSGLRWCLYCAVNKNTDELWFHLFPYDPQVGTQLLNRAQTIIFGEGMPPRISETPAWHECVFCPMKGVCFKTKEPDHNCRTCKYSHPLADGTWECALNKPEIITQPKLGCDCHTLRPELC